MSALDPTLDTALRGAAPLAFVAVQIDLPAATVRLLDGAGTITIDGQAFLGRDDTYGALGAIEAIEDGQGDDAPQVQVTLYVPSNTATADLGAPDAQGSPVRIWLGAADPATGAALGEPQLIFAGEVDTATIEIDQNSKDLTYQCVSGFERLFTADEGVRLNSVWHESIWPGELGLEYVANVQQTMPWGQDGQRPALIVDRTTPSITSSQQSYSV
ncbi:MAG: hypothetical protein WDM92_06375 [Caulobacteraceae bacterium]